MADNLDEEKLVDADKAQAGTAQNDFPNTDGSGDSKSECGEDEGILLEDDDFDLDLDGSLPPVVRLRKWCDSDIICNRQLAAQKILGTLQQVLNQKNEVHEVVSVICALSDDREGVVRAELLKHLPYIAQFCSRRSHLTSIAEQLLVPIIIKLNEDVEAQVRQIAQATLLMFFEKRLIDQSRAEECIPFVIQQAIDGISEECRSEAVTLMCQLTEYLPELTEKFFLDPFLMLVTDQVILVRKACAMGIGKIFNTIGAKLAEDVLLPKFLQLCVDDNWIVRKACAESIVEFSTYLDSEVARSAISRAFVSLLCDDSRWVKLSAYQNLGKLISKFSRREESSVKNETCSEAKLELYLNNSSSGNESSGTEADLDESHSRTSSSNHSWEKSSISVGKAESTSVDEPDDGSISKEMYDNLHYWRLPLPEVEIDLEVISSQSDLQPKCDADEVSDGEVFPFPTTSCEKALQSETKEKDNLAQPSECETSSSFANLPNHLPTSSSIVESPSMQESTPSFTKVCCPEHQEPVLEAEQVLPDEDDENSISPYDQTVVPPELLEKYIDMTEPVLLSPVMHSELIIHCAFSFPAVVKTLGRQHWPCLRKVYKLLASDLQWKVRRTAASYLHVLAQILGPRVTTKELTPLFLSFLSDVDEVRSEVIGNLTAFLKHTERSTRKDLLLDIKPHFKMDGGIFERNWRMRHSLARELFTSERLFEISDVYVHILPAAISFLKDRVCVVRQQAILSVARIMKRFPCKSEERFSLIAVLQERFRDSNVWRWRQMYVYLCLAIANEQSVRHQDYGCQLGGSLLGLAWDTVANVRISIARCLVELPKCYMLSLEVDHPEVLRHAILHLQSDEDTDVKQIAQNIQSNLVSCDAEHQTVTYELIKDEW